MIRVRPSRVIMSLAALLFLGAALHFWIAPHRMAERFGIEATGSAGVATLRADLGGLFAGLSLVCAAALWTGRRLFNLAAALVLAAIVFGRLVAWVANAGPAEDVTSLLIELLVLAAVVGAARTPTSPAVIPGADPRGSRRPRLS